MIAVLGTIVGVIILGSAISYFIFKKYRGQSAHVRKSSVTGDKNGVKEVEQSSKVSVQNMTPNAVGDDMY